MSQCLWHCRHHIGRNGADFCIAVNCCYHSYASQIIKFENSGLKDKNILYLNFF